MPDTASESIDTPAPPASGGKSKLTAAVVVLVAVIAAGKYFKLQDRLQDVLEWIQSLGVWGPVIFIGIYVLCCILFIPGSVLTLASGFLFGVIKGTAIVSVASTTGAALSFLLGRYFARDVIARKIEGNEKFAAIDTAVAKEGFKIVLLTRLSPVFPFNLLNYAYGLTKVNFKDYVLASWIGMFPGTVMYVYLGTLVKNLAELFSSTPREKTTAEWALFVVGLIVTVVVTVYVTKVAKRALDSSVAPDATTG